MAKTVLGGVLLAVLLVPAAVSTEDKVTIEVGKPAPDFTLKDHEGKEVKVSSFQGKKNVLLAFYPKDFTGGWTRELTRFREEHDLFVKNQVQVLGISNDPVDSHKKFCDSLKLPFPLLSDVGEKASELYGIVVTRDGKKYSGRSVFLIDRKGTVRYANPKYDVSKEADHEALVKAVASLGGAAGGGDPKRPPAEEKPKTPAEKPR